MEPYLGFVSEFVVQSSWDEPEDDELHACIASTGMPCSRLDEDAIAALAPSRSPEKMVFADSRIIQQLLGDSLAVVDTYPDCFRSLFGRQIKLARASDADLACESVPFFCKPAVGHKGSFQSRVVNTPEEASNAQRERGDQDVYVCDVIDLVSEHRLFMSAPLSSGSDSSSGAATPAPARVWGSVEYSEHVLESDKIRARSIPAAFLDDVVVACSGMGFVVVDVACTRNGEWCVVECNPPFSLSSYGLDVNIYMEYCCRAWAACVQRRPGTDET